MKKCILFILLTVLYSTSCKKKDANSQPTEPSQFVINGRVVLPSGSSLAGTALSIMTPLAKSTVDERGNFSLTSYSRGFSPQLVLDASGELAMMGFTYPGQTDFTVDAKSTAIAIAMMAPWTYDLTDDAKLKLIQELKGSPKMPGVEAAINQALKDNSVFDTASAVFIASLSELFGDVGSKQAGSGGDAVSVVASGTKVSFINNGVAYYHAIDVYKDGATAPVAELHLLPVKFVATSLGEFIQQSIDLFTGGGKVEEAEYDLAGKGEGDYEFRVNSGYKYEYSSEYRRARSYNRAIWAMQVIETVFPAFDDLKDNTLCIYEILARLRGIMDSLPDDLSQKDPHVAAGIIIEHLSKQDLKTLYIDDCFDVDMGDFVNPFMKALGRYGTLLKVVPAGASIGFSVAQWHYYTPNYSYCYSWHSNTLMSCNNVATVTPDSIFSPATVDFRSFQIKVGNAVNWTLSSDRSWIQLSKYSGNGYGLIGIDIDSNSSTIPRQATITVTAAGNPKLYVRLFQEGKGIDSLALYEAEMLGNWTVVTDIAGSWYATAQDEAKPNGVLLRHSNTNATGTTNYNPPQTMGWSIAGNSLTGFYIIYGGYSSKRVSYPLTQIVVDAGVYHSVCTK